MIKRSLLALLLVTLQSSAGFCDACRLDDRPMCFRDELRLIAREDAIHPALPVATGAARDAADVPLLDCRLPGEFERQRALLLACNNLIDNTPDLFVEIVRQAGGKIEIVLLVSHVEDCEKARDLLRAQSPPLRHVRFVELPHDTMWARDYGPVIVSSKEGRPVVIDADYDPSRPNDDRVPLELARLLNLPVVQLPLRLDGGNLLSNGHGLAITTYRLFHENGVSELDQEWMRAILWDTFGLSRVVVLEPLVGEPTGHVDMFATFTSPNTVVVGQYDPAIDPENAVILDRNADKLAQLRTAKGPLQVVRIPMPKHDDAVWRTFTNVIYANGVLMVPTYADADQAEQTKTLVTYASLLPEWKVVGIDASRIIESAGALHCITMNLGPLGVLPDFPRPRTHAEIELGLAAENSILLMEQEHDFFPWSTFRGAAGDSIDSRLSTNWIRSTVIHRRDTVHSQLWMRQRSRWKQFEQPVSPVNLTRRSSHSSISTR